MRLKKISPSLKNTISKCFPSYAGRKWSISARESKSVATYWDSGSRSDYCLVDLLTGWVTRIPEINPLIEKPPQPIRLEPNQLLVEHARSGTTSRIYLHCHQTNLINLLTGCEAAPQ